MSSNHFKCALCGEMFEKDRTDEAALADSQQLWGEIPQEKQATVCEPCFVKLIRYHHPSEVIHPYCNTCGWRKGGPGSWDGKACKCGHSEPPITKKYAN